MKKLYLYILLLFTSLNLAFAEPRLWNLQNADILSIINEVSLETGKNFVIDPRVHGKISLISSKPIKQEQLYDVFLSILALLGYSAVTSGDVIKIIPNLEFSEYAARLAGTGDETVVRVISLANITATQLIPIIRPMLPQWCVVTSYPPGNILILLGHANNLQHIINMVASIDKSADINVDIIPLHQASALQLTNVLNNLQNASRNTGEMPQVAFAADERSNSILLNGNRNARLRMRALIKHLDSPARSQGNTDVIYLRYLLAKNIAPTLSKIAENMQGHNTSLNMFIQRTSNTVILPEPSTNSIIITAPPSIISALHSIIAKLDIRPAQVLVEGIIVEINQDDLRNLGIEWGGRLDKEHLFPLSNFSEFGQGIIGIIPHQKIQAILNALQSNRNVNILSTPSVVVLDNHRALLDIGQDVPTKNGEYATTNTSSVTPFNTITYKKVALTLEVVPQINLGNAVRLSVRLKNDSLQNPDKMDLTPLINTSQITNSVIVNSCDILVLGGLIRNSIIDNLEKVPVLGDIPALGLLFQHQTRKLEKKNLVIFLKPVIMHNTEDANALTYSKYELTRNAQIDWPVDLTNPAEQKAGNILPLWKEDIELPKPFANANQPSTQRHL